MQQPKIINQQVDPETARYTRILREGEKMAQERLVTLEREQAMRTTRRRRETVGWLGLAACVAGSVTIGMTRDTFWWGIAAAVLGGFGTIILMLAYWWASEIEY